MRMRIIGVLAVALLASAAAAEAYETKRMRLDAWRGDEQQDGREPQPTLDAARDEAARFYEERRRRLSDAWRNRADGAA
jgi:hypothetical protein